VEVLEVAAPNLKQIRAKLEGEKKRFQEELNQLKVSPDSDERREGSPFGKREEEATESMELEKRLALENKLEALISEVDRALNKLDAGTYGNCDICGQPIDPARLDALPQAIMCVSCRQKIKNAKIKLPSI
jgi:DnaK suppressor protein